MHWNIIGIKSAYIVLIISSCFEACVVQRFHLQEIYARDRFCILPRMKKSFHVMLHYYFVGHKWVICGSHPYCSVGQYCRSNGSAGVTHFQPYSEASRILYLYTTCYYINSWGVQHMFMELCENLAFVFTSSIAASNSSRDDSLNSSRDDSFPHCFKPSCFSLPCNWSADSWICA